MKKRLLTLVKILAAVYAAFCALLFFFQEKFIFFPHKLPAGYQFRFKQPFTEMHIPMDDGVLLNSLLFPAAQSRGLILYLHGNGGALDSWGEIAPDYTCLGYDFFLVDYRGYGKSGGTARSEDRFFADLQEVYDQLKQRYAEEKIIIIGYSLGTGPAAWLAAANHPRVLILQAPYESLTDMMRRHYPLVPTFLLRYRFDTARWLRGCAMPVVIFHGDRDEMIPYEAALRLRHSLKKGDTFITLRGEGHYGITANRDYQRDLARLLAPR